MRAVDFRNPEDSWHELQRFKRGFLPAMQDAIPPAIASFLSYFPEKKPRVLVLTREPGSFQRDYMPHVIESLEKLGTPREIEVHEFDVSNIVNATIGKSNLDEAQKLPFGKGAFDFVFGQSILHYGKMGSWIREVKRVMKYNACFLHVHDDAPNPQLIDPKWKVPVLSFDKISDADAPAKTAMEAHSHLISMAAHHADALKVSNASFTFGGSTIVDSSHKMGFFGNHNMDESNLFDFNMGITACATDKKLPVGKKKLDYTAIAFVATKAPLNPMVHHAIDKMEKLAKK